MSAPVQFRSLGKGEGFGQLGEWLTVIHEVNRVASVLGLCPVFGEPESSGPWWAGGYAEEYADARVLHRDDDPKTVSVISKTDKGAELIKLALANLGLKGGV